MSLLRDAMFLIGLIVCVVAIWTWSHHWGMIAAGLSLMILAAALSYNHKHGLKFDGRDTR
ncbi:hypothetical protein LCGC14_0863890 [marine sediment metagenome]|uniref:Uncharacterized protein n=1 Tax=marine sediment metagenome TaxID=412755 RepID=A0A0F9P6K2_9ZZZZ